MSAPISLSNIMKYELFTYRICNITDQELATAVIEGEKRNWKGILMAILVIIIMCSFIAATVFLLSPQIREYWTLYYFLTSYCPYPVTHYPWIIPTYQPSECKEMTWMEMEYSSSLPWIQQQTWWLPDPLFVTSSFLSSIQFRCQFLTTSRIRILYFSKIVFRFWERQELNLE